ncbi:MAG: NAD(P)-dependent oxidoreductase [Methyloligellaceae bacterium]
MTDKKLGFIGLGVMGEPICRNIAVKSGYSMTVCDLNTASIKRLAKYGINKAGSIGELAEAVDILFLSLPGGTEVEHIITMPDGIAVRGREGLILVDLSTSPVGLTKQMADLLSSRNITYADAPVARTRQAAEDGTLSVMVGASKETFDLVLPLLSHAGSEVTHCGPVGCGQVTKILNNMVLFETVVALSEALALGKAAGMEAELLFDTLTKGSADSFALRNHGMKAMIKDIFPEGAFPTDYALKDVSYALDLAKDTGVIAHGAELAKSRMEKARNAGYGKEYFPVLTRVTDRVR